MGNSLCAIILAKVNEEIELTDNLVRQLPGDRLDWRPNIPGAFSAGVLVGHLLECLAGFCAVLYALKPDRLSHFLELRRLEVNHRCGSAEARERIAVYDARINEGFALLQDADLVKPVATVFVSGGEALLTLLLGNLEHLINHKHQLFVYLRLIGLNLSSRDLYQFRGK